MHSSSNGTLDSRRGLFHVNILEMYLEHFHGRHILMTLRADEAFAYITYCL